MVSLPDLLLSDFDTSVRHIAAQPFLLEAQVRRKICRHVPDYLLVTDGGPMVVDGGVRGGRLTGLHLTEAALSTTPDDFAALITRTYRAAVDNAEPQVRAATAALDDDPDVSHMRTEIGDRPPTLPTDVEDTEEISWMPATRLNPAARQRTDTALAADSANGHNPHIAQLCGVNKPL